MIHTMCLSAHLYSIVMIFRPPHGQAGTLRPATPSHAHTHTHVLVRMWHIFADTFFFRTSTPQQQQQSLQPTMSRRIRARLPTAPLTRHSLLKAVLPFGSPAPQRAAEARCGDRHRCSHAAGPRCARCRVCARVPAGRFADFRIAFGLEGHWQPRFAWMSHTARKLCLHGNKGRRQSCVTTKMVFVKGVSVH